MKGTCPCECGAEKVPGSGGGKIVDAAVAALAAANGERATYCKVMATIAPVDPKSFPIEIEINLPIVWNGKANTAAEVSTAS